MGTTRSKGSLRPAVVRPFSMPIPITYTFSTSNHEDYVVLDETPPSNEIVSKAIVIEPCTQCIYIVDESLHCVRAFSPSLKQLFKFSGGKQYPIWYPWGMCIKHNKIYVTEHYSCELSIFTLNGERITKCSYSRTKNPKMNLAFPTGLTVDDSGNIYICDQSNHRILILCHYIEGYIEFARSTLRQPRDIKIHNENIVVLDTLEGMKKSMYADQWVLRVYSQKEELLRIIRLHTLKLVYFFDITNNSNFVVSGLTHIELISDKGIELRTFQNGILDTQTKYQPGIVVDRKTNELVILSSIQFRNLVFIKFPIND